MMDDLTLRIIAVFALLLASIAGVLMPTLVHRATTGRWPGMRGAVHKQDAAVSSGSDQPAEVRAVPAPGSGGGLVTAAAVLLPNDPAPIGGGDDPYTESASRPGEAAGATGGGSLPWRMNYMHIVKLLSALGCGAIIATGTCHVAPPAIEKLTDALHSEYPYAMMIVTAVIIVLYSVEHELTLQLQLRANRLQELAIEQRGAAAAAAAARRSSAAQRRQSSAAGSQFSAKEDALEVDQSSKAKLIRASVATHVLEIGVAVHSVIVGVTLGLITDRDEVRTLTVALTFHQFSEGCAIGAAVMESRLGLRHSVILWLIFALTAPLGVAAGIGIEQASGDTESYSWNLAQGILESVACGVLLYMSLVDMMPNLFKLPAADEHDCEADDGEVGANQPGNADRPLVQGRTAVTSTYGATTTSGGDSSQPAADSPPPFWYRSSVYLALSVGAAVMCVIAKWA